jgi:hypothetical protein
VNLLGSPPGGNRLDWYGRWIAIAGVFLVVSGRLSHTDGLTLLGLAIAIFGIGLGFRASNANLQIYARQLIPGGTNQADPFAGKSDATPTESVAAPPHIYVGTVVWVGGIGKGVRLELSSWGLRIKSTWMSGLLMGKQPSWTVPWSSVRTVEVAKVSGTGSAPGAVKFSITEPSTVFLFFSRRPTELLEDARGHLAK